MNKNDLGKSPAFPRNPYQDPNGTWSESSSHKGTEGMDLRTYIATKCLAGYISDNSNLTVLKISSKDYAGDCAQIAVELADALIAELSKDTV